MHGDVAYCKKHGHDWHVIYGENDGDMRLTHVICNRCGYSHIICSFFEDVNE